MSTRLQVLGPHTGTPRALLGMSCPGGHIFEAGNSGTGFPGAASGDTFTADMLTIYPASASYVVDYQMEAATATPESFFVRVVLDPWQAAGPEDVTSPPQTTFAVPTVGGAVNGAAQAPVGTYDDPVDLYWDFYNDPLDGAPWTVAKVNGYRWGFHLISTLADTHQSTFAAGVNKSHTMRIEIWAFDAELPTAAGELEAGAMPVGVTIGATGETVAGGRAAGVGVGSVGEIEVEE